MGILWEYLSAQARLGVASPGPRWGPVTLGKEQLICLFHRKEKKNARRKEREP